MDSTNDWLLKTLALAKKRMGFCAPNPAVGAIVVKDGQIIGEGYHLGPGHPHAEVGAINQAGALAKGADIYVSLEPCCHYGRTPPCTEKIIQAGIARVFYGYTDPNPIVAGQGAALLQKKGVDCQRVALPEITEFYAPYQFWFDHQRPYLIAKIALTADGFVAEKNGQPIAITGAACQQLTHQYRMTSDAILTTIRTIQADNPQFSVRLNNQVIKKPLYIVDARAELSSDAQVFKTTASLSIFHGEKADQSRLARLRSLGVRCVPVPDQNGLLDYDQILAYIGQAGVHQLWLEAGAHFFSTVFLNHLYQQSIMYVSPNKLGREGRSLAFDFKDALAKANRCEQVGEDCVYFFY